MDKNEQGHPERSATIFGTTICPSGRNSCPGYGDLEDRQYCCPSPLQSDSYFCCDYSEKHKHSPRINLVEILPGIVGGVIIFALLLMCLFCRCCYLYKWRHRKDNTEKAGQTDSPELMPRRRWMRLNDWRPVTTSVSLDEANCRVQMKWHATNLIRNDHIQRWDGLHGYRQSACFHAGDSSEQGGSWIGPHGHHSVNQFPQIVPGYPPAPPSYSSSSYTTNVNPAPVRPIPLGHLSFSPKWNMLAFLTTR